MEQNKHKTTLMIMAIGVITLSVIAGTYAFFTAAGNANASNDIQATTVGNLTMTLSDDSQLGISGAIDPQNLKFTTYLKVENGGQGPQYVRLMFKNLINTYSDYLVYSLDEVQAIPESGEAVVVKNYKDKVVVPKASVSTNTELANGVLVQGGTTANDGTITPKNHYYRVTIEYLYSDTVDQSDDISKQFVTEFTMELGSKPVFTANPNSPIKLVDANSGDAVMTQLTTEHIEVGQKIAIGTEKFYVISNNNGTIRALAEYNINVGNIYNSSETKTGEIQSTDTGYGLQSSSAKGHVNGASEYIGTVAFNPINTNRSTNYPDYQGNNIARGYTDYSVSSIKGYVDAYLETINGSSYGNGQITSANLISYNELVSLGCIYDSSNRTCSNSAYPWVYSTSYWSGSANDDSRVWYVASHGGFNTLDYISDGYFGVRPVITLNESSF